MWVSLLPTPSVEQFKVRMPFLEMLDWCLKIKNAIGFDLNKLHQNAAYERGRYSLNEINKLKESWKLRSSWYSPLDSLIAAILVIFVTTNLTHWVASYPVPVFPPPCDLNRCGITTWPCRMDFNDTRYPYISYTVYWKC